MEDILQKYMEARNKVTHYTKIQEDCKLLIKARLKSEHENSYEKDGVVAHLKTQYKSTVQKKDVPSEIWEKYAVTTPFEVLTVKKK